LLPSLAAMGVPGVHLMSWMTILVELVGGLAVLLGVFVPVFAVPDSGEVFGTPGDSSRSRAP
jgi:uncharacterized membrane protein YphA (DoxX/SURF4 family)